MPKNTTHILVIRLSAMGDVAISAPVLCAFTNQHPNIRVTVLTTAFFEPFFKNIPNVSVFTMDKKGTHKGLLGLYQLSKQLIKLNIDAVADLHGVLRSNILVRLLKLKGIPYQQIDKGRKEKKALTQAKNKIFKPLATSANRYAKVFEQLGFPVQLNQSATQKPLNLPQNIKQFIGQSNLKCIGIAPFAAHKGKMYPLNQMKLIIEQLAQTHQVLLFGGGDAEAKQLENIAETNSNIKSVAKQFSFEDELALISNLDVMLAMDSGNGHLAAMYGVPVITIWGVTHPYAGFAPFNQPKENQITPDLVKYPLIPTSVYGNQYPEGYLSCFDTILPETIVTKLLQIL